MRWLGQESVAMDPVVGSTSALTIPSGGFGKPSPPSSGLSASACFIKLVQIGNADFAPSSPSSELSSNPTQTTHNRFGVYPANQPSRDVPVLPAAVAVNPIARA